MYAVLKLLPIFFTFVAVGTNITYGVWLARAARDSEHLPVVLRGLKILDDRLANPASGLLLLLLVTGLAMIFVGRLSLATPWLIILYLMVMKPALWR